MTGENTPITALKAVKTPRDPFDRLFTTIVERRLGDPATSYVAKLTAKGRAKIAQKLGEEAVETVIAAMCGTGAATGDDRTALIGEATDLIFHLAVLLADAGLSFDDLRAELTRREGMSGIAEKARRFPSPEGEGKRRPIPSTKGNQIMPVPALGPYDPANVFARILRGEIPCTKVYEDSFALAFNDLNPQAPAHVLVIPKGAYVSWADFSASASDAEIAGFVRAVGTVARQLGLEEPGYRLLANAGIDAHQEVPHLHVHIFGGRPLGPLLAR